MNQAHSRQDQTAERTDPNKHVKDFLRYYLDFAQPPRYAVLLNGIWGIGKTYLVKKILNDLYQSKEKPVLYVSLYGISSYEDLDRAIYAAMYPIIDTKLVGTTSKIARMTLGAFKITPNVEISDFLPKLKNALYVFDDLERCNLQIKRAMGYINDFIEHDDCKVIIIANEDAIKEKSEYLEGREKTVGKVLEVMPSTAEAYDFFLSKIEDVAVRNLLLLRRGKISGIFAQSGLHNLRILQQTLWDFERVFKVVDQKFKEHEAGVDALLSLIFVFSFEVKSGRLTQNDLSRRMEHQLLRAFAKSDSKAELHNFDKSMKRYESEDLTDTTLSNEVLIDVLFKGLVQPEDINSCLANSPHYQGAIEQAPWRIVWHMFDVPEEAFLTALEKMERQFLQREFSIPGEIFHVFGLRIWAARERILSLSSEVVIEQSKHYIDCLRTSGVLSGVENPNKSVDRAAYSGLGFRDRENDEFKQLVSYFWDQWEMARREKFPDWANEVLDAMRGNEDISPLISYSDENVGLYRHIPILAVLQPEEFAAAWIGMAGPAQTKVSAALVDRYTDFTLENSLMLEKPWLAAVISECDKLLPRATPTTRFRMNALTSHLKQKV